MEDLIKALSGENAFRILAPRHFARLLPDGTPPATLSRKIANACRYKAIKPIRKGLYLNLLAHPKVELAEAAGFIRTCAIVSLQTVLGDSLALNNYTQDVTCLIPSSGTNTAGGEVVFSGGRFSFNRMKDSLLYAGDISDRLDQSRGYMRATPEKALIDWILLAKNGSMSMPPAHDIDMEYLDVDRLHRLAVASNIQNEIHELLSKIEAASVEADSGFQL